MKIDCCCLDVLERENERGFRAASLGELSVVLDEKKNSKNVISSLSLSNSLFLARPPVGAIRLRSSSTNFKRPENKRIEFFYTEKASRHTLSLTFVFFFFSLQRVRERDRLERRERVRLRQHQHARLVRDVSLDQPPVDEPRDEALDGVRVRGTAAPLEGRRDLRQRQLVGSWRPRAAGRGRVQGSDLADEPARDRGPQLLEQEVGPGPDVLPVLFCFFEFFLLKMEMRRNSEREKKSAREREKRARPRKEKKNSKKLTTSSRRGPRPGS